MAALFSEFSRVVADESVTPSSGGALGFSEVVIFERCVFLREILPPLSVNGAIALQEEPRERINE